MERLGPYRILRSIGLGGMGEVYLARLERASGFEKRVAIKRARPELAADPQFMELFEAEARLAAALTHRHIVQIFDFGHDEGAAWIAMEYVQGVDLKAVMDEQRGALPPGMAVEIGLACARALDYAHRASDSRGRPLGLVHQDVSPQNVLLSFEGDVKLADFGIAQATVHRPAEGGLRGKYAYMTPEQVSGERPDARSDQFSLGIVLYEMLSGQRAFFSKEGSESILDRVRAAAPQAPLASCAPTLAPELVAVVERAMARDPEARFSDLGSFASALSEAAQEAGVRVGSPPLAAWLRERFPHRLAALQATAPPAEVTETGEAPIAERTATAVVPVRAPSVPLRPSVDAFEATAPARRPVSAEQAIVEPLPEPEPERAPSRLPLLLLLLLPAAALAWFLTRPEPPLIVGLDQGLVSAAVVDASAPDAKPRDAKPVDAKPIDAAPGPVDAAPVPVDATPDRAVRRPKPRRPVRPKPRPKPIAVVQPEVVARPEPKVDPKPEVVPKPPEGPRVKVGAAGTGGGWRTVPPSGLLVSVPARGGPSVKIRVQVRQGRFLGTFDSRPYGPLSVDGKALGNTPLANIPLRPGLRRVSVRGPDGRSTKITIDLSG